MRGVSRPLHSVQREITLRQLEVSTTKCAFWRVSGELFHTLVGQSRTLSLAWLPSGEDALLCGMEDGTVSLLCFTPHSRLRAIAFPAHTAPVECLAVPPRKACFASGAHSELFVWKRAAVLPHAFEEGQWTPHLDLGTPPQTSQTQSQAVVVTSIHWSRLTLLVTYLHHGIIIYDSVNWTRLRAIPPHGCIADASLSPDGSILAISNIVSGFDIYAMDTGASIGSLDNPSTHAVRAVPVLFAHGGSAIIGGSTIGVVNVWDGTTQRVQHKVKVAGEV
ncbi:WD40 repeat-like protein [Pilatotrama ljubarskyi]|nr:WD40 repeat-like protein [Pilatotrama ljubarskyi]